MGKVKVGVAGYGVIGLRLATGVSLQEDMELVGVSDVAPTLSVRGLVEAGMPYKFFNAMPENEEKLKAAGVPISGSMEDLVEQCDIILDASPGGIGAKNKELYKRMGKKAIFQGGESNDVADAFFHGYANYEKGLGKDFLKLTSCNTTGLIRAVDWLDRAVGVDKLAITIIRRVADPGDYHRGLTNALQMDKAPNHQAVDLMNIMPHIDATGILVHTPVTHGHIITVVAKTKKKINKVNTLEILGTHPRIRTVKIEDGFIGNASLFKYARDMGKLRGDLYEIALWDESIVNSGDDIMFAINIPQESVVIPENMDAIRAAMSMQLTGDAATNETNKYLGMKLSALV
jgi:glyceraldehyde-3-phosphate dehydrogenase (NAD(P))